jgi:hypothetical protein
MAMDICDSARSSLWLCACAPLFLELKKLRPPKWSELHIKKNRLPPSG